MLKSNVIQAFIAEYGIPYTLNATQFYHFNFMINNKISFKVKSANIKLTDMDFKLKIYFTFSLRVSQKYITAACIPVYYNMHGQVTECLCNYSVF